MLDSAVGVNSLESPPKNFTFTEIYFSYRNRLAGFIRNVCYDSSAVEDALQDTFVKIGRSLDQYRGNGTLESWMFRIARNTALDYNRRTIARKKLHHDPLEKREIIDQSPTADRVAVNSDYQKIIRLATPQLPARYQKALELFSQGYTAPEIARQIKTTTPATKQIIMRAKKSIRKILNETGTANDPKF